MNALTLALALSASSAVIEFVDPDSGDYTLKSAIVTVDNGAYETNFEWMPTSQLPANAYQGDGYGSFLGDIMSTVNSMLIPLDQVVNAPALGEVQPSGVPGEYDLWVYISGRGTDPGYENDYLFFRLSDAESSAPEPMQYAFYPVDVPQPVLGDINGNGVLDIHDIDALQWEALNSEYDAKFDVNQDGILSQADPDFWITDLKKTWFGDVNLDGEFNSSDLVRILSTGNYEQPLFSGWSSGDFDNDEYVTTSDLILALADGGYEQGPRAATAAVPEPSSAILLLLGAIIVRHKSKRHE